MTGCTTQGNLSFINHCLTRYQSHHFTSYPPCWQEEQVKGWETITQTTKIKQRWLSTRNVECQFWEEHRCKSKCLSQLMILWWCRNRDSILVFDLNVWNVKKKKKKMILLDKTSSQLCLLTAGLYFCNMISPNQLTPNTVFDLLGGGGVVHQY